jgi:hypothetical protein
VIYNGTAYVAGGLAANGQALSAAEPTLSDVDTCPVAALDSCTFARSASLKHRRFSQVMISTDAGIYDIGGIVPDDQTGTHFNPSGQIELAPGGDFASSTDDPISLATPRAFAAGVTAETSSGTVLYVCGGFDQAHNAMTDIEASHIGISGRLGPFASVGTLTQQRSSPAAAVVGHCLVVAGGNGNSSASPGSWDSFAIDAQTGSLTPAASGTLATPRTGDVAVATGSQLFLIGGSPAFDPGFHALGSIDAYSVDPSSCGLQFMSTSVGLPEGRWSAAVLATPDSTGVGVHVISGETNGEVVIGSIAAGHLP